MEKIVELVLKYQKDRKEEEFIKILNCFKLAINKYLCSVKLKDKEDIGQVVLFSIYVIIINFKYKEADFDEHLFNKNTLEYLIKNEFKNVNKTMNQKYITKYIKDCGEEKFIRAFYSKRLRDIFIKDYNLYCNNNAFIKKVQKTLSGIRFKYIKRTKETMSLNEIYEDDMELLDMVIDETTNIKEKPFEKYQMTIDEIVFLEKFIENNRLLSESEVAKKLGISQQAVSKRRQKIRKKYHFLRKEVN